MSKDFSNRNGQLIKPSPYAPSSDIEENAIKCFRDSIDTSRVKSHVAEGDKTPNHDGFIEILDIEHIPLGKMTVQLKGIPKGENKFQCKMETLAYSRKLSEPFLLICVDSVNEKVYWKQIYYSMVEAKDGQDSFTIHFAESDTIDSKGVYIEKWIDVCKEYQKIHLLLSNNWQEFENHDMHLTASKKSNSCADCKEVNNKIETKKLENASVALLEDDAEMIECLQELLPVDRLFIFENLDYAYQSLIEENNIADIDILIFDVMLPLPQKIKLPPDLRPYNAGLIFHKVLEAKIGKEISTLFFTGVSGAGIEIGEMGKKLNAYIRSCPSKRKFLPKPAKIQEIKEMLKELL